MYTLTEENLHQISGGLNGFKITVDIDVPLSDADALEGLLFDLFTDKLNADTFAQVLLAMPNDFNDMKFVSLLIREY